MFERFTERARQVVVLAQDEALLLRHDYIGTEHLLLGLLREETGLAAIALRSLDIKLDEVRTRVVEEFGRGSGMETGMVPFTARSKKMLNQALREALSLGQDYIGTEHFLLGLVADNSSPGAQILLDLGADAETIRGAVVRLVPPPRRQSLESSQPDPPQLIILCPDCAEPIEAIASHQASPRLQLAAEGDRTCPGCGKQWRISYTVTWEEQPS